ncbi:MAG: phosphatase PAP2 family protein, partial [Gammaproteobacteria bacterium]
ELRWVIPLSGLGATVFYEHGWRGTWQWTESYFAAHIVTASLKHVTHQTRPNGECCGSFPSGHASTAFMGAGFIHARYGWRWALPAYVGAGYVAYSRVYADKHYTRDVVAGAAVGILASFYFTSPYKDVSVVPIAGDGIIGIRISGDF